MNIGLSSSKGVCVDEYESVIFIRGSVSMNMGLSSSKAGSVSMNMGLSSSKWVCIPKIYGSVTTPFTQDPHSHNLIFIDTNLLN